MGGVASSCYDHQDGHRDKRQRKDGRYSSISDNYNSIEEVTEALAQAGLESSNLIIGIDFTKSNEWTGQRSFNGLSLHHTGDLPNPYEQAISIIGRTLSTFDDDNMIPCFGFGDGSTHDQNVFSFYPDGRPCNGLTEASTRYREIAPHVRLAGPTSFAPIIETAMSIVEESGGQYHVLLIIADGQVTRSIDTENGELSSQEQKTIESIIRASELPLSIVLVGVGDGPWDMMKQFDDNISSRLFDNFQFVNFSEIMSRTIPQTRKEAIFALEALMEIPSQYKATIELRILGRQTGRYRRRIALAPPRTSSDTTRNVPITSQEEGTSPNNVSHDDAHGTSIPLPSIPLPVVHLSSSTTHGTAPSLSTLPRESVSHDHHINGAVPADTTIPLPAVHLLSSTTHGTVPSLSTLPRESLSHDDHINGAVPASTSSESSRNISNEENECPVCLVNRKEMVFGCGHQTCCTCSQILQKCPICRSQIKTRIKIY